MTAPRTKKVAMFWRGVAAIGLGLASSLVVSTWISVQQHTQDLSNFNSAAKSVLAAGNAIETAINNNHGASYTVLVNLCRSVPGCVVPPIKTSPNTQGAK